MDTLRAVRLALYFVVGLVLGGFGVVAFAGVTSWQASGFTSTTASGACSAWYAAQTGYQGNPDYSMDGPIELHDQGAYYLGTCALKYNGNLVSSRPSVRSTGKCDAGTTFNVTTGQCDVPCPAAGTSLGGDDTMMQTDAGSSVSGSVCINGCSHGYQASSCVGSGSSKTCGVYGPFVSMGQSCVGDPGVPVVGNPPVPCTFPNAPGTVNGVVVCVPGGSTSQKKTTTATKTDPNGDPSTTTQQQVTTCDGDNCTTTTTTTNTGGGVGGGVIGGSGSDPAGGQNGTTTTTVDQPKSDYCATNPASATCQKAGSFGGDCSTGFVCQGDAVECAAAKASWETACAMKKSDGTSLGEKIAAGNDPDAANMPWHSSQKQSNDVSSLLNQSNPYGASCIPDIHFSIAGRSGTIPTSEWCSMLTWIGNLMLAGALMGAAAIIFRRS